MAEFVTLTGRLPTDLANAISDAIHAAIDAGMNTDEAVCVVLGVAADYGRDSYGDAYLQSMCGVLMAHAGRPPRAGMAAMDPQEAGIVAGWRKGGGAEPDTVALAHRQLDAEIEALAADDLRRRNGEDAT